MSTTNETNMFTNSTTIYNTTLMPEVNCTTEMLNQSTPVPKADDSGIDPKAIEMVGYVTVPLLFVIGLTGNIFSISVMQTKYFRRSTICIYLTALSLSDTTFILVGPFTKSFVKDLFGRDPKALTVAGCKAFFFVFRSAKICSSWFVVTICIERFIVVWLPFKAKSISNRRTALIAVLSVTLSILTFDGIWTITSDIINGVCIPSVTTDSTRDLSAGFVIAGTAIFNIIPTCVLLIFTPLTALKLFRQQSFRREISLSPGNEDAVRITRMLVSIMCAYILLVTPISIAHSVAFFSGDSIFESTNPRFIVFREFAQILEQLNYCVNFFLYVTFNITFRRSFYSMLGFQARENNTRNVVATRQNGNESSDKTGSTPSTGLPVSRDVTG